MAEQQDLNLMQRIAKIRKSVEVMRKNKSGYGYKYVSEDEILAKITAGLDKYDLSFYPGIQPQTLEAVHLSYKKTKTAGKGEFYEENVNEVLVKADEIYTIVVNSTGEKIEVPWGLVGQQADGAQAFGSGLTYSNRYFLLKFFNISTTEDDPDAWRAKQRKAAEEAEAAKVQELIDEIDSYIRAYIASHPESSKEVGAVAKKYAPDGDYTEITESIIAAKLLHELQEKFKEE